jgi:hypothetical protein
MKLKKLENKNVQLIKGNKVIKSFNPAATLEITQEGKAVGLFYDGANIFDFYPQTIDQLEVFPDPSTNFSGSVEDLLEELSISFFFEELGGGGSTDYVENVSLVGGSLDFTAIGSAFGGSVSLSGLNTNFANTDLALDGDRAHDGDGNGLEMSNFNDILFEILESFEVQSREATIATQETIIDSQDFIDIITDVLTLNIPSADTVGKVLTLNNAVTKEVEFTDISGLGANIYNTDDSLTGDREVDIDGNEIAFTNFQKFEISSGVQLEIQSQQAAIEIDEDLEIVTQDTTLSSDNLDVITDIFKLNIPSADTVGKVLAVTNATNKEVEFISASSLVSSNTIFSEQDETTTSTGAVWSTRHTFTGNLDIGTYQIDFFTYMGAGGAFAELQNGIRVNSVLEYARGFSTFFVVEQAYPNTYLLEVTTAGAFTIEGQFIRITAGITVDCNFSNMIIKKL